jgi:hypothetical protein
MYRCEAVSVEGFVQQLAVGYVQHGHLFYVTGRIPERKDPRRVDAKLIERYGIDISRATRSRNRRAGRASVQYIRHGRFFVLIATHGGHEFFEQEPGIRDIREHPIQFAGYSISYRRGADRKWHASVRIAPDEYLWLESFLVDLGKREPAQRVGGELHRLPFEPYAPIRRQLLNLLRGVNRARKAAGLEEVSIEALRLRRRSVRVFALERLQYAQGNRI